MVIEASADSIGRYCLCDLWQARLDEPDTLSADAVM
jgi:hypothetical protein